MEVVYFCLILLAVVVILLGIDFTRFVIAARKEPKKNEPMGVKVDAGGILFVQGRKTYYQMPNGTRRKIADYPMDLKPGSRDMNMFLSMMDQARKLKENEGRAARKQAKLAMEAVAKEEAEAK